MNVITLQTISDKRAALYDEHDKLCKADPHDRVANDRRQSIFKQLCAIPSKLQHYSEIVVEDNVTIEHIVHIEWT